MKLKLCLLFVVIACFRVAETHTLAKNTASVRNVIQPPSAAVINKVEEMCIKYMDHRYKNVTTEAILIGAEPMVVKKLDCYQVEKLIVGGEKAEPKQYPHMALIGYGDKKEEIEWICGGSLISERYVLSAAHCNHGSHGNPSWARLGELDLRTTNPDEEDPHDYKIIETKDHPKYTTQDSYHDITLYKLHQIVNFNAFIRPVCLYPRGKFPNGTETKVEITGWGANGAAGERTDALQRAIIKLVDTNVCEKVFSKAQRFRNGFLSKFQLCAGDVVNGSDTCQGDSGGPLQIPISTEVCMYYQIGITSVGKLDCGDKTSPAVYTKVWIYLEWIQSIVWPN